VRINAIVRATTSRETYFETFGAEKFFAAIELQAGR
jgi:hypothetical protein